MNGGCTKSSRLVVCHLRDQGTGRAVARRHPIDPPGPSHQAASSCQRDFSFTLRAFLDHERGEDRRLGALPSPRDISAASTDGIQVVGSVLDGPVFVPAAPSQPYDPEERQVVAHETGHKAARTLATYSKRRPEPLDRYR